EVRPVAQEPANLGIFSLRISRWYSVAHRGASNVDASAAEECRGRDKEGIYALAHKTCKSNVDFACGASTNDMGLQAHGAGSGLDISQSGLGNDHIARVDEHAYARGRGHQLTQKLQPLCRQLPNQNVDASRVAARPSQTSNQTKPDWIFGSEE